MEKNEEFLEKVKDKEKNFGHSYFKRHKKLFIFLIIIIVTGFAVGIAAIIDGLNGIKILGNFITDQILGMQWLNALLGMALIGIFGSDFMATRWGGAIQFFIYDTIKIIVLLCLLIFVISYIQSYFPPERTKKILGKFHGIGANAVGALLGTVTPLLLMLFHTYLYGLYTGRHIKRRNVQFFNFQSSRRFRSIYSVGQRIRFIYCIFFCQFLSKNLY